MQHELLDLICCPACKEQLEVTALEYNEAEILGSHLTSLCGKGLLCRGAIATSF